MMYCLHYLTDYVHKTSSYLPSFKHIETPAGIRSLGLALFLAKSRTLPVITCREQFGIWKMVYARISPKHLFFRMENDDMAPQDDSVSRNFGPMLTNLTLR